MKSERATEKFSNINGILFDVDGTLYYHTPLRAIMLFLLLMFNLSKPKDLLKKIKVISEYRKAQEVLRQSGQMLPDCTERQTTLTSKSSDETKEYVSKVKVEWFEKRPLPFLPICRRRGLKPVLRKLHQSGFKLGAFSDYPVKEKLSALGVSGFFSLSLSASDPGINGFKPVTNGFTEAARRMGLKPSEVMYVGDRPEVDGAGASGANMSVVILGGHFRRKKHSDYLRINSLYELVDIIDSRHLGRTGYID